MQPLLTQLPEDSPLRYDTRKATAAFQKHEVRIEHEDPMLHHDKLLEHAYEAFAKELELSTTEDEVAAFKAYMPAAPAFKDTVPALQFLGQHYKLVPLSNVDNATIEETCRGPLKGVKFDAIYTAQDIGSYKPDLKNFRYLVKHIEEDFGVPKEGILHVAQSLRADHVATKLMGLESVWIGRGREVGEDEERDLYFKEGKVAHGWTFNSLGDLAAAVTKELEETS